MQEYENKKGSPKELPLSGSMFHSKSTQFKVSKKGYHHILRILF